MKRKQLESFLQSLDTFDCPKLGLEQYETGPALAAEILSVIQTDGDLCDAIVGDLGCGCGVFMLGAARLGSSYAVGIDVDEVALNICQENIRNSDLETFTELIQMDIFMGIPSESRFHGKFDVIITNPPFGTKNNAGTDLHFVECGLQMLRQGGRLYSLHKTATRSHIFRRAKKVQLWQDLIDDLSCIAELRWELTRTYRHQRRDSIDIAVDLLKFIKR